MFIFTPEFYLESADFSCEYCINSNSWCLNDRGETGVSSSCRSAREMARDNWNFYHFRLRAYSYIWHGKMSRLQKLTRLDRVSSLARLQIRHEGDPTGDATLTILDISLRSYHYAYYLLYILRIYIKKFPNNSSLNASSLKLYNCRLI